LGYVWEMCNRIWKGEDWIEWNEGIIVSIRKQGEGDKVKEYVTAGYVNADVVQNICDDFDGKIEKGSRGGRLPQN